MLSVVQETEFDHAAGACICTDVGCAQLVRRMVRVYDYCAISALATNRHRGEGSMRPSLEWAAKALMAVEVGRP